ncbi:MAG: hypothetical protein GY723_23100 [bacterium]|nr:hypothetical protein [bacterium]MCP5068609.1 hypothetical protein [bacterium]
MKFALPLLLPLFIAAACTTTLGKGSPPTSLSQAVEIYTAQGGTKAMALAVDPGTGRRTWGAAAALLQSTAKKRALETCGRNVARLRLNATCQLLAVGNEPAQETEAACFAGTLHEARCSAQRTFAPGRKNTP